MQKIQSTTAVGWTWCSCCYCWTTDDIVKIVWKPATRSAAKSTAKNIYERIFPTDRSSYYVSFFAARLDTRSPSIYPTFVASIKHTFIFIPVVLVSYHRYRCLLRVPPAKFCHLSFRSRVSVFSHGIPRCDTISFKLRSFLTPVTARSHRSYTMQSYLTRLSTHEHLLLGSILTKYMVRKRLVHFF
jgi:hypothetical protein